MQRRKRIIGLIATAMLALPWLAAAPFVSAGDPCYHGFEMPATTVEAGTDVKLMPCAFAPTVTRIAVGETVSFRNGPELAHLVTGANQAWGSRDVEVQPNGTVSYAFDKPGIYPYACAIHRGMSGAIIVGSATDVLPLGAVDQGTGQAGAGDSPASTATPSGGSLMIVVAAVAGTIIAAGIVLMALRQRRSAVRSPFRP